MIGFFRFLFSIFSSGAKEAPEAKHDSPPIVPVKQRARSEKEVQIWFKTFPSAKAFWVLDGDTLQVTSRSKVITVRLDSIDCPEDGQPWGDMAARALTRMTWDYDIRLEVHGLDSYNRTLATLYVWNPEKKVWINVNERMVMLGHAWVMRKFYDHLPRDRQSKLNRLERWAKSKRLGLWQSDNPIPPWLWRREERFND